jgi:hypothetical protein
MKGPLLSTLKNLLIIGQKEGHISLSALSAELGGLGEEETLVFLRQVFPEQGGAQIYYKENECWVDINANSIQYKLALSPNEWIYLHSLLEKGEQELAANSIRQKINDSGPVRAVIDLLERLETSELQLSEKEHIHAQFLDQAAIDKKQVHLITGEDKKYNVFPRKVVHLEGQLSLIAEDIYDHCLLVVPISELIKIEVAENTTQPKVSSFEVDDFIVAIRSMGEKETRLILKIHNPQSVNLFPTHQFLGKPCMVTNPNGDLLWAAYVEATDPLYEWILSLGMDVEILDPIEFKSEYLSYCEAKLRKIA